VEQTVKVIRRHRAVVVASRKALGSDVRRCRTPFNVETISLQRIRSFKQSGQVASPRLRLRNHRYGGHQVISPLPMAKPTSLKPGFVVPLVRLVTIFSALTWFQISGLLARLLGRSSIQQRAASLRKTFQFLGPTFVKLGQQLSLRADFLPYAYCEELSKLLDGAKPFPTAQAVRIIEKNLGAALTDIFAEFDPTPFGAASLACVYRARLRTGELVAVKVRRPGIGALVAADLRVFDWVLTCAELLTVLKPGLTENLRAELRLMLLGETDFRKEGRFMDMFRRQARRNKLSVTAPRVFFEYTTPEVLITQLISGISMWELMHAVDWQDDAFLTRVGQDGIRPKKTASNLARAVHVQLLENLFFHADPHPANLIVLPHNQICFIDFGICGRFSAKTRRTWHQLHYHMLRRDVSRMVQCALNLVEPLPPIDLEKYTKQLEAIFADWVYATTSRDAEWWERSTSQNWLKYMGVARQFGVPVNLETLQFFRATLLYDSVIMRLDKSFDFNKHYGRYAESAGRRSRKRVLRFLRNRWCGPTATDFARIEEIADIAQQSLYKVQRILQLPDALIQRSIGKFAYVLRLFLEGCFLVVCLALLASSVHGWSKGALPSPTELLMALLHSPFFAVPAVIVGLILLRKVLWHLGTPDPWGHA
jgi:ubiquinone biosynthesis protein